MWTPLRPNWTVLARMLKPPAATASSHPPNMCSGLLLARSCRWSPAALTVSHRPLPLPLLLPLPPACIACALLLCCFGAGRLRMRADTLVLWVNCCSGHQLPGAALGE